MISLFYTEKNEQVLNWKERLESMTVPFMLIESRHDIPYLADSQQKAVGPEAIDAFLDQYEKDMAAWNQDRCDMWFFDEI